MRYLFSLLLVMLLGTSTFAGEKITYSVDGQPYEGYFIKTKPGAPLVLRENIYLPGQLAQNKNF